MTVHRDIKGIELMYRRITREKDKTRQEKRREEREAERKGEKLVFGLLFCCKVKREEKTKTKTQKMKETEDKSREREEKEQQNETGEKKNMIDRMAMRAKSDESERETNLILFCTCLMAGSFFTAGC